MEIIQQYRKQRESLNGRPSSPSSALSIPWGRWQQVPVQARAHAASKHWPHAKGSCKTHLLVLLLLLGLLVRLRLLDGGGPLGSTDLQRLVPLGGNGSKVGADDTTLVLHGLARPLLCDLLCDTLLVHPPVHLCPGDLARVLALQEERLILGGGEPEDLETKAVNTHGVLRLAAGATLLSPRTKRRPLLG